MPDSANPTISLIPTPARNNTAVSEADWVKARPSSSPRRRRRWTSSATPFSSSALPCRAAGSRRAISFDTPTGKKSLGDLFEGAASCLLYHFMFGPDWAAGCHGCSFFADGI